MTTTDDADRDALAALLGDHGYDMECIGGFKRAADRVLAAGFRRAPSAPTPPELDCRPGTIMLHTPTPPEAGEDKRETARRMHQWLSKNWTVEDGGQWEDRALAAERERDAADEQIAYWQRAAHEIEQELTKERDAAVADAARLHEVVRREADGARRVVAGACSSMEFPIDWWQRKLDRLNAALAAPAAKEGER